MKIIIPMAGMGKRMRPHTLTIPKPLLPVGGKPIVQRLVESIAAVTKEKIDEIAFVTGHFGTQVENELKEIAKRVGAKGSIHYQDDPMGTAHAVLCAADALQGKVVVAFADTLFRASFNMDEEKDGIIWVHKVDDPSSFGVVKLDENSFITDFIEKPAQPVSNLAIIGIYYFREGEKLKKELQFLVDNNYRVNGEFQLTDALENMKNKGTRFTTETVEEWLDCGNKNATVQTNQRILEFEKEDALISPSAQITDSLIIKPGFIG
ncbi:MAG: nucleotidyltransferase family protein, partial [Bacteroidota bacterium]